MFENDKKFEFSKDKFKTLKNRGFNKENIINSIEVNI